MSLADRLNSALVRAELQPVASEVPRREPEATVEEVKAPESTETTYETLKEGLKSAHRHEPDDFGTTIIVVEQIGDRIQLPMRVGKYIVDDIQKRSDGRYEVHLVSDQR